MRGQGQDVQETTAVTLLTDAPGVEHGVAAEVVNSGCILDFSALKTTRAAWLQGGSGRRFGSQSKDAAVCHGKPRSEGRADLGWRRRAAELGASWV